MKYEITANLNIEKDIIELDDDLTEEEVKNKLYEYMSSNIDWNYRKVKQ